jgi:hypothetical protein
VLQRFHIVLKYTIEGDLLTEVYNRGGFTHAGGVVTCLAKGRYRITAKVEHTGSLVGTYLYLGTNVNSEESQGQQVGSGNQATVTDTLEIEAGGTIDAKLTSAFTVSSTSRFNTLTIERVGDSTGNQATGAGTSLLSNENPQNVLVNYQTVTKAIDGDFSGTNVTITKNGNQVTVTSDSSASHSAAGEALTAIGFIPDWALPTSDVWTSHYQNTSNVARIGVQTNGRLRTAYFEWSGALDTAITGTLGSLNISYSIAG